MRSFPHPSRSAAVVTCAARFLSTPSSTGTGRTSGGVSDAENTNTSAESSGTKATAESVTAPPRPVRHGKESFMMEIEKAERAAAQAAKPKPNAAFLETLDAIKKQNDAGTNGPEGRRKSFFSTERVAERKVKKQEAMATERKKLLVFRDVGMDLDKAILSRDILLIPKYFYYGVEYAIDNELERMLRYFNEHAINELKLINDGKLMRGPDRLVKSGFVYPATEDITRLSALLTPTGAAPGSAGGARASTSSAEQIAYGTSGTKSTFAGGQVKKPTMVIFSQLGQKVGGQADRMWRDIALSYASPQFTSLMYPKLRVGGDATSTDAAAPGVGSKTPSEDAASNVSIVQSKPLDVLSLRSLDVQTYKWVHRLYVRRFLRSLVDNTYQVDLSPTTTTVASAAIGKSATTDSSEFKAAHGGTLDDMNVRRAYNDWLIATTAVGSGMLRPLFKEGVRNYLSPYAMLLDHKGQVRWMSSGLPDGKERAALPKLFQQLGLEYFRDR